MHVEVRGVCVQFPLVFRFCYIAGNQNMKRDSVLRSFTVIPIFQLSKSSDDSRSTTAGMQLDGKKKKISFATEPKVVPKDPPVDKLTNQVEDIKRYLLAIGQCKHHMSFDFYVNQLIEVQQVIHQELEFRFWYQRGSMRTSRAELKHFMSLNQSVNRNPKWFLGSMPSSVVQPHPSYEMLVTPRFPSKLQLVAVTPYDETSLDIVLRRGESDSNDVNFLHLTMYGINGCFLFELREVGDEYMVNPHPRAIMNINCPFKPLGLAKFDPTDSMFLLCQKGGQAILISLYLNYDFAFDSKQVKFT